MSVGQGIATRYAEIGRLEVTKNGEFKRSRIDTGDVVLYVTVPVRRYNFYIRERIPS